MRVVLSGYYGFHNVGDEAILLSIITALRQERPNIEITVLSNDIEYTKKTYQVDAVNRWKFSEVYQTLRNSDALISGGGSLLQDKTGLKSVPYYLGIMQLARLARKPYFIYAQGLGPIDRPWNKKMTKRVLSNAAFVTVRDEDSASLLRSFGYKKEIELVPDPVIGLNAGDYESDWIKRVRVSNKPLLAVSVRDWETSIPYMEKVEEVLDRCAEHGLTPLFIPMHGEQDAHTSEKVASQMSSEVMIAPYDVSIEEKIAIIKECDVLIGMRLHALIFAAVASTPMVGLSYDPKIDAFLKQVQQPLGGHVESNWDVEQMVEAIVTQYQNREAQQKVLENTVSSLKQQANDTAKKVINYLS
ncbi:polysaccharide pyruvyl transferase CsaB [Bacillus solimangrovi]|uniref:Polysaccharide pyruvyl transferase CsaB n=1 Tax=Bacillus solimangrovi TaxID=1305675 RepID=A0A1E5LDL7_9BACI|nr:polysaccharide pyruvyl transferase CsaB [Bacillus solimangrovi]OEH92183.1 polysaccharide pyruvyl transferase CsaB [Bacillus solimangrovi]